MTCKLHQRVCIDSPDFELSRFSSLVQEGICPQYYSNAIQMRSFASNIFEQISSGKKAKH
uniref:Uncharacterized protein n=1 Tax=Anguilla anguilla TaxID=7936 RepID=A0A0E9RR89_ANGAN